MDSREKALSRVLFWDALVLSALSTYELAARIDGLWKPLRMFVNMAFGEAIPFSRALHYVDWTVFEAPSFLLLCAILGILALFARRSRKGTALLLIPGAALAVWGFMLRLSLFGELIQLLKLLPLLLLLLLSLSRVVVPRPSSAPRGQSRTALPRRRRIDRLHHKRRSTF